MSSAAQAPRYLTPKAFGRRWSISHVLVRTLIREGVLPAVLVSRPGATKQHFRIDPEEGDAAMRARRVEVQRQK